MYWLTCYMYVHMMYVRMCNVHMHMYTMYIHTYVHTYMYLCTPSVHCRLSVHRLIHAYIHVHVHLQYVYTYCLTCYIHVCMYMYVQFTCVRTTCVHVHTYMYMLNYIFLSRWGCCLFYSVWFFFLSSLFFSFFLSSCGALCTWLFMYVRTYVRQWTLLFVIAHAYIMYMYIHTYRSRASDGAWYGLKHVLCIVWLFNNHHYHVCVCTSFSLPDRKSVV